MHRSDEKGVALVFTLFLMAALSAMAVSLMFLAQTETSASRNYRTMSQARYAGEAGVHRAINYLLNSYTPPTAMTGYTITTSPVQYSSADVTLAPTVAASNYPDSAVKSAFAAAASGSLAVGSGTVSYSSTAKLLSMQSVALYGGGTGTVQTWQITTVGTVPGTLPATVEVSAILERTTVAAQTYAIFATGAGCGAINLGGTALTNSYDSRDYGGTGTPATADYGGGVGTNGNLAISGTVDVKGNLDTPRMGVGDCTAGTPTALSAGGHASVSGSIVKLPQAKVYPTPEALPMPLASAPYTNGGPPYTGTQSVSASVVSCTLITTQNTNTTCSASGSDITVTTNGSTPLVFGNLSLGSHVNLKIQYGTGTPPVAGATGTAIVNANSIVLGAGAELRLGTNSTVVLNVAGRDTSGSSTPGLATPIDFSGGGFANPTYDASRLQIVYGGTGRIELIGGPSASATVYAPNASVRLNGNADFYGSVLSNTYSNNGTASVHYDRALQTKFVTLGNWVMTSFSWKKY